MDRVSIGPVKGLRIAVAAFVISLVLSLVVIAGGGYLLTHRSQEASETHEAVCALSEDLEARTKAAKDFLRDHPHGIPGVPPATLRQSITNQERSVDALSILSC